MARTVLYSGWLMGWVLSNYVDASLLLKNVCAPSHGKEDVDGIEFMAGSRAVTCAFQRLGWKFIPYDITFDRRSMDLNSAGGFALGPWFHGCARFHC